jgi:hypothetical protein
MEESDILENEYATIIEQQKQLSNRKAEIIRCLQKIFHGVEPGVIVLYKGKRYKIHHTRTQCWSIYDRQHPPWVYGFLQKKDGAWSEKITDLYYEWKLVK